MTQVELYWIPLGAGGWFVKRNGRLYERLVAARERRPAAPLFHSALLVRLDGVSYAIELCPEASGDHGRVASGAVGSPVLRRFRVFRYEARCWAGGVIPDLQYAVGGPRVVSSERAACRAILDCASSIPTPTWGRDELDRGEMWNSNSVISWLLERGGIDAKRLKPPSGGRAPGWSAGVAEARSA